MIFPVRTCAHSAGSTDMEKEPGDRGGGGGGWSQSQQRLFFSK